ncbi:Glucan endo-1 3-beta-glucosidase [Prunus yedoensis var. nudiflora]|uniref:Glucan endo-1 3-beta-glucosidase n=1 Tax=Prunus yedoensis var. nudiflora TaxID=2094558 RepID=A0A314YWE8_PRUYE|nr:Glucan endo-1 3-beta-glucosidase [Prunus yedoensis var. nudiflora]
MRKTLVVVLSLSLTILSFGGAHAATIFFKNNCPYMVWPGTLTSEHAPFQNGHYNAAVSLYRSLPVLCTVHVDIGWSFVSLMLDRQKVEDILYVMLMLILWIGSHPIVMCNGSGAIPPATLAEFNIPAGGGQDFYDVSLVDGFNLPMSVTPQGGTEATARCLVAGRT